MLHGTERVYERPRPFLIDHIALSLRLHADEGRVDGVAELSLRRVATSAGSQILRLDAVAFAIESVSLRVTKRAGGSPQKRFSAVDHVYDDEALEVVIPDHLREGVLRVRYSAKPRRGMYFLAPDDAVPHRPRQIWTQCQDEDARHIFPCHDKPHVKQTMDIAVQVEPGWFVLSNGDLVSGRAAQKKGDFRYRMRDALPSYLFTIVAGEFERIDDTVGDLPVPYYVPRGRRADGERTFKNTPAMIRLFGELTGVDYPWTKYAQIVVSDFIFGGMENTGATTMYEHILLDERAAIDVSSDDLIAHELAHQWFGDLVTCRDWSHAWLNEGFATYFEHVWRRHHLGEDEYQRGLSVDLRAYLSEVGHRYKRPVVCQDYEAPIDIFDRHLYEKGSLILHQLRIKLGDEAFFAALKLYLGRHRGGVVETRDLLRAMEETSGQSLEETFEHGLLRAGHPRVTVKISYADQLLVVNVKQSLGSDERPFVFDLQLDVALPGKRRLQRETRRVRQGGDTLVFPCDERPDYVVVDPEMIIIGSVTVEAPADMLRKQLAQAASGRAKTQAADALAKRDDPTTIAALGETLASGRVFWGARAAAASALGRIRTPDAYEHLASAAKTKHPKVRRAVAAALGHFRTEAAAKLLARLAGDDESVLVASSACRSLGMTRQPLAYDTLVGLLDRESWADVLRAGAIDGLAKLRDERALAPLTERTVYGVPTRARRAAISALAELSQSREIRETLEELLEDADPHLRVSVALALGDLDDTEARGALRNQLGRDLDARVRRRIREVLRDLGRKNKRDLRAIRDELETLRREHRELMARLTKLEQKRAAKRPK
ncbi:MAG: M1 family aminopeptidase [Polyangiaceae bacterium]